MKISLDANAVSNALALGLEDLNADALNIEVPFQMRRRGVELKLYLGDPPPGIERTLAQKIVKARQHHCQIIAGKAFAEIAEAEGVSKRRIKDVTNLALLAPEIIEAIASGGKPTALTTDCLIKNRFSAIWSEQSAQFAGL